MRFEEVIQALREGKRVQNSSMVGTNSYIALDTKSKCLTYVCDGVAGNWSTHGIGEDTWEIFPETMRVADYLVHSNGVWQTDLSIGYVKSQLYSVWLQKTYRVGEQPEGAIMIPGSERESPTYG